MFDIKCSQLFIFPDNILFHYCDKNVQIILKLTKDLRHYNYYLGEG